MTAVPAIRAFLPDKTLYNIKPTTRWGEAYLAPEEILRED